MKILHVQKPNIYQRPSWSGKKKKFTDLLMSPKPWKFEQDEENVKKNNKLHTL